MIICSQEGLICADFERYICSVIKDTEQVHKVILTDINFDNRIVLFADSEEETCNKLFKAIIKAYEQGRRVFICSMRKTEAKESKVVESKVAAGKEPASEVTE
jgi:hypothetical protein